MTQNNKYEICTKKFSSILDDKAGRKKYSNVISAIDKLRNNILNHTDDDINLDYCDIQECFSETKTGNNTSS